MLKKTLLLVCGILMLSGCAQKMDAPSAPQTVDSSPTQSENRDYENAIGELENKTEEEFKRVAKEQAKLLGIKDSWESAKTKNNENTTVGLKLNNKNKQTFHNMRVEFAMMNMKGEIMYSLFKSKSKLESGQTWEPKISSAELSASDKNEVVFVIPCKLEYYDREQKMVIQNPLIQTAEDGSYRLNIESFVKNSYTIK